MPYLPHVLMIVCALLRPASLAASEAASNEPSLDQAMETLAVLSPEESLRIFRRIDQAVQTSLPEERPALARLLLDHMTSADTPPAVRQRIAHHGLPLLADEHILPVLADLLSQDGDRPVLATVVICSIPGPASSALLLKALAHSAPEVRNSAAMECGLRREVDAVPALISLAQAGEIVALRALGRIASPSAISFLGSRTSWDSPADKVAVWADAGLSDLLLADTGNAAACQAGLAMVDHGKISEAMLASLLSNPHPRIAFSSIAMLEKYPDPSLTSLLIHAFADTTSPDYRARILDAFAFRADTNAWPIVLESLTSEHPGIRLAAIHAAGCLDIPDALQPLLDVARSNDLVAATAAHKSLLRLRNQATAEAMRKIAATGNAPLRAFFLDLLDQRADPAARELAFLALTQSAADIRRTGWDFLATHPRASEYPHILQQLCAAGSPADIRYAEKAAYRAGVLLQRSEERIAPLAERFSDAPPDVAQSLIRLLGLFGGPEAIVPLRKAMERGATRDAAIRALAAWNGPEAVNDLKDIARGTNVPTHKTLALRALQRLASSDKLPISDRLAILHDLPSFTDDKAIRDFARTTLTVLDPITRIRQNIPDGLRVMAFLDCGTGVLRDRRMEDGPVLISEKAQEQIFDPQNNVPPSVASIIFGNKLLFRLEHLHPDKTYYLGFSWWNGDGQERRQALQVGRGMAPIWGEAVELPAANKTGSWGQMSLPLQIREADAGMIHIQFLKIAGPNAVLSEIWLLAEENL